MERREFFKAALAAGVTTHQGLQTAVEAAAGASPDGNIPKRPYKDGVELSIIGFGSIVVIGMEQEGADSVERGVNYFDVAPSYGNGEAEEKLGIALKPHRDRVFLACKTGFRDAQMAQEELEQSLRRLHTDHFDLYQFHAVSNMEQVEQILAPGGAVEVFLKARSGDYGPVRVRFRSVSRELRLLFRRGIRSSGSETGQGERGRAARVEGPCLLEGEGRDVPEVLVSPGGREGACPSRPALHPL